MRRYRAVALLAVAGLALSACTAPAVDSSWDLPQWPAATVAVTSMPAPLDAASVPSLLDHRIRNDDVGIQARWVELPGDTSFDERVAEVVRGAIDAGAAASGTGYAPAVFPQGSGMDARGCLTGSTTRPAADILADPLLGPANGVGVALVCDIVLATGPFLGQRIRTVASDGTDTGAVVYADTATGEAVTGEELWTDDTLLWLYAEIVNMSRRQTGSIGTSVQAPDEPGRALMFAGLAQTLVAPDATLVVPIPPGFTSPELQSLGVAPTAEPLLIGIPADLARDRLTPFAASLTSAAAEHAAFSPPALTPAGFEKVDCALVPCVALTYDDGPSELTPGILDELAERRAAATFFVVGERLRFNAELVKRTVDEGHLVENHTWSHPMLPTLTPEQVAAEIEETSAAILETTGQPTRVFRPPYAEYDDMVLETAEMAAILWDVDSLDYAKVSDAIVLTRAVDLPAPGAIVLQHDIQQNTARTAGAVYDGLLDRGFSLVNLAQLFDGELPTSGVVRPLP